MTYFLFLYTLLYGGMNAYTVWCFRKAFPAHPRLIREFTFFCCVMVFGPILVRVLWKLAPAQVIQTFTLGAFTWCAWIFWFCCAAWTLDLWNGLLRLFHGAAWQNAPAAVNARNKMLISSIVILMASVWGVQEAKLLRVVTCHVPLKRLPPGTPPITVLQVSDLHLTRLIGRNRLKNVVDIANATRPSVIVSTGDMIDNTLDELHEEAAMWASLKPPLGKFAVNGNHEFYMGASVSRKFHEAAGFRLLHGESVKLEGVPLRMAGVDDPLADNMRPDSDEKVCTNEDEALTRRHFPEAVILLKHRPQVDSGSSQLFDLQLSGHTHGGQIYPFRWAVWLQYPWVQGLHELKNSNFLNINQGCGTWGPPFRVLAPPEVTLLVLEPAL